MDNTFIQEKLLAWLTFNPGLALTGFRTTRPWSLKLSMKLNSLRRIKLIIKIITKT